MKIRHVRAGINLFLFLFPGDVYVSGKPAYWTGFYSSRPYWKRLHREVENELRAAEILFTFANAIARQSGSVPDIKALEYKYEQLASSRHDFSTFTHHDGITGTSRRWTMEDYGERLFRALENSVSLQIQSLKIIYKKVAKRQLPSPITKDYVRERFDKLPEKVPLEVFGDKEEYATKLVIFNSLAWKRTELIKLLVKKEPVQVVDSEGNPVLSQINPIFNRDGETDTIRIKEGVFELVFLAELEPLSVSTFRIQRVEVGGHRNQLDHASVLAKVRCKACANLNETVFHNENVKEEESQVAPNSKTTKILIL